MDELSEVWYSGYHRRPITHSSCQLKTAITITVLILGGLSWVVIGVTADSLQMKTGGYTMCTFGLMAAICLFWWHYQGRIQKIWKVGAESPTLGLPSPVPRMKTSLFRTCSIQHCGRIRDAK